MTAKPQDATSARFDQLTLAPATLQNLEQLGYTQMTPIQAASLPIALLGKDLIAQAQTGSGKTAAFALALLANTVATGAGLIAAVTATAIEKASLPGNKALAGLYHLVAAGETSWHQYASHVIKRAKALRPDLPWAVQDIAPVPSSAFVTAARRPHNSRLSTAKLQAAFGINLPGWQQGVDDMLAQVLTSTPSK